MLALEHVEVLICFLNVYPLEFVSRYRDPQLQVGENYSYMLNLRQIVCKY